MVRTRIFLNLLPFVVIVLAIGVYAIALFSRLAASVDVVVMKNYQSIMAVQAMELALVRMQSGVLVTFETRSNLGRRIFDDSASGFETNLWIQTTNASSELEMSLNDQLRTNFHNFKMTGLALFRGTDEARRKRLYNLAFYPTLAQITGLLKEVRTLNHEAILRTKETAARGVREVTRLMILGLAVALVLSTYACYRLGLSILRPIQNLTRATRELATGDLREAVPVESPDELGQLAASFNAMAAQLREYRQSTADHLVRLHRTMETALASFPEPIFVLNGDGQVDLKNQAAAELCHALDTRGRLPPAVEQLARDVFETGRDYRPNNFQSAIRFAEQDPARFFLPRAVTMRHRENALIGVAVVLFDVTRFRLLDDAKSNLVATVSHELKTPLTSVRMALHLLADRHFGALSEPQFELVTTARDSTERLLRILNDLLDLTRLEEGRSSLVRESARPADIVQSAVAQMQAALIGKPMRVVASVDPDLPELKVDTQRLNHVFSNLTSNALKHSPAEGTIRIRATRADGQSVRFSVTDEGPGVPAEYRHRIFERFFRMPGQSDSGAGLGLSIAREIVLAHGGRIGVRSEPGRGSEFFFVLPIEPEERGLEDAAPEFQARPEP